MKKYFIVAASVIAVFAAIYIDAKDITEVQSIDASQRNQITVSSGGGGAVATAAALTNLNNIFTGTSNQFNGKFFINTNALGNATYGNRTTLLVYTNGGNFVSIVNEGPGQQAGIQFGARDTGAGAMAIIVENGAGKLRIDPNNGTGLTGWEILGISANPLSGDSIGTNNFLGDGNTTMRWDLNGARFKVDGVPTFSGNVTNLVGTGLSNVVSYSGGLVTNRFTIP